VLQAPPISFSYIWSPEKCLLSTADQKICWSKDLKGFITHKLKEWDSFIIDNIQCIIDTGCSIPCYTDVRRLQDISVTQFSTQSLDTLDTCLTDSSSRLHVTILRLHFDLTDVSLPIHLQETRVRVLADVALCWASSYRRFERFFWICLTLQMARILQNVGSNFPKTVESYSGRHGRSPTALWFTPVLRKLQSLTHLVAYQVTCYDISLVCNCLFVLWM
jgi:hypothetical protein